MPYAKKICGIYKIVNVAKNECYIGQSQNIKKRISEHFRLLKSGKHVNARLQNAFNKYGENNFNWNVEIVCEDANDLNALEEAFISGDATFVEKMFYNIADFAKAPMRGKKHTDEIRAKISKKRRASSFDYRSSEYRKKLARAQHERLFSDENFVARVKFIINNDGMTYAERGRAVGLDTSSTRRLAIKYAHMKGAV